MSTLSAAEEHLHQRILKNDRIIIRGLLRKEPWALALFDGPAEPGTFRYLVEHGNFNEGNIQRIWDLAARQREKMWKRKKDAKVMEEWSGEWGRSEMDGRHEGNMHGLGLLTEPANIDLRRHEKNASAAALNYIGTEGEAPLATREQMARWDTERRNATSARALHYQNAPGRGTQHAPIVVTSPSTVRQVRHYQNGSYAHRIADPRSTAQLPHHLPNVHGSMYRVTAPLATEQQWRGGLMATDRNRHHEFSRHHMHGHQGPQPRYRYVGEFPAAR